MLPSEKIKDVISRLKHLMHGHNYEVSFGIDIFENCKTSDDFYYQLKLKYKDIKPESVKPLLFSKTDIWKEIEFSFVFRGDSHAGLRLSLENEQALKQEQDKYKLFIQQFLSDETIIYSYPGEEGIPFYVVYWGFAFILFNVNKPSLFIFGGASD